MKSAGWPVRSMALRISATRLVTPVEVSLWTTITDLIGVAAVLGQLGLDHGRIDAVAPVPGDEIDLDPQADGHVLPEGGKVPRLEHQDLVPGGKGVDQARLPRAGPRRCEDHDRAGRFEHALEAFENPSGQGLELRPPVIDGGFGQGPEHLLGDIRRSRNLQKMTPARICHLAPPFILSIALDYAKRPFYYFQYVQG